MAKGDKSIKKEIIEKREDFIDGRNFPLENVTVEWCYFVNPDTAYQKSEWKCTILLKESLAESLADAGFNVKVRPDGQHYIVANRKTNTNSGPMDPPEVVDQDGETPFDGRKIGNGSIVNLRVFAKYWDVNGVIHLPMRLNKVQVVKLVEYSQGDEDFTPVGGGTTGEDIPF